MLPNDGNMKSWAFWNTNLSICYAVYLFLIHSYLPLSDQFFYIRVRGSDYLYYFKSRKIAAILILY